MKLGLPALPLLNRPAAPLCNRAAFPFKTLHKMKLPIACGAPRPAWLQVRLHYIRFCTKKGHKARRREGDKCFFRCFFLRLAVFARVSPRPRSALRFIAPPLLDCLDGDTVYAYSILEFNEE